MRLSQMSPNMPAFSVKPLNQVTLMTWKSRVDTTLLEQRIISDIIETNEGPLLFEGSTVAPLAAEVMQRVQELTNKLVRIHLNHSNVGQDDSIGGYNVDYLLRMPFAEINWKNQEWRIITNLMIHRAVVLTRGGWYPGISMNISTVGIAGFITQELDMQVTM